MKENTKKALYESIMQKVSQQVVEMMNESFKEDNIKIKKIKQKLEEISRKEPTETFRLSICCGPYDDLYHGTFFGGYYEKDIHSIPFNLIKDEYITDILLGQEAQNEYEKYIERGSFNYKDGYCMIYTKLHRRQSPDDYYKCLLMVKLTNAGGKVLATHLFDSIEKSKHNQDNEDPLKRDKYTRHSIRREKAEEIRRQRKEQSRELSKENNIPNDYSDNKNRIFIENLNIDNLVSEFITYINQEITSDIDETEVEKMIKYTLEDMLDDICYSY